MLHKENKDNEYIEGIIRFVKKTKGCAGFDHDGKIKKEVLEEIAKNKTHLYYKKAKWLLKKWYNIYVILFNF